MKSLKIMKYHIDVSFSPLPAARNVAHWQVPTEALIFHFTDEAAAGILHGLRKLDSGRGRQ